MRMTWNVTLLLAIGVGSPSPAAAEATDWWSADNSIVTELLTRDVGQWSRELNERTSPATPVELMRRFSVSMRAGHLQRVRSVIDAMSDTDLEKSQLSSMADFLIGRKDWLTARYFLERLPQAEPGWGYVLIEDWRQTGDAKQIDTWLAERMKANRRYWLKERLRFRRHLGTEGELVEQLAVSVREQPQNVEVALSFLDATDVVRQSGEDIAWLGDVCRPPSAYSSYRLGTALRGSPRAAIKLLDYSLEMPFTQEDAAALKDLVSHRAIARVGPPPSLEQELRYSTKRALLTALHAAGQSDRAQKLLEEISRMQINGLPPVGLDVMAGQIQAASGARVVEKKIKEAEQENQESVDYWEKRASYYTGRKEYPAAIAAYEKAMQLSTPEPDSNAPVSSGTGRRPYVLSSYVDLLERAGRHDSAVQLLQREFGDAPLDGHYAERIVVMLLHGPQSTFMAIDRERLWAYLAARRKWSNNEEQLLRRFVEGEASDKLQATLERAEALARDRDPSRSLVLGTVLNRNKLHSRAIPWLEDALQRTDETYQQPTITVYLFASYLGAGDWQKAEKLRGRDPHVSPDAFGSIAVVAAKAGETAEAMRLWKQRTNFDRSNISHLDEMLEAGLRKPLLEFYRALAEQDPDCQTIEPIVQRIRRTT